MPKLWDFCKPFRVAKKKLKYKWWLTWPLFSKMVVDIWQIQRLEPNYTGCSDGPCVWHHRGRAERSWGGKLLERRGLRDSSLTHTHTCPYCGILWQIAVFSVAVFWKKIKQEDYMWLNITCIWVSVLGSLLAEWRFWVPCSKRDKLG